MDSFIKDLKLKVQCLICKEMMVEPKVLHCFHIFCKSCLKQSVQLDQQRNILKCPNCGSQTLLQDLNDVEDLQTSPVHSKILKVLEFVENRKICSVSSSHSEAFWQCIDCNRSLCQNCLDNHSEFTKNHQVISLSDLKKEDVEKMLARESPCKIHDKQEVEFYCQDCDMLICVLCLKDHRIHKTKTLKEFVTMKKDLILKNLEQIDEIRTHEKANKQQEEIAQMIQSDGKKAKEDIKKTTQKLMKQLMQQEQQLLDQVEKDVAKSERNLRILCHATQAHKYVTDFFEAGTASDLVSIQDVNNPEAVFYDPYPQEATGFLFDGNKELYKQIESGLGEVRRFKLADPKMSSIKTDSLTSNVEIGKTTKLTVELRTAKGEMTDEIVENITINFTPKANVELGELKMADDGKVTMDFIPHACGKLTVQVKGKSPLNSSRIPLEIYVKTQLFKWNQALNTGSKSFTGIAVNRTNSKIAVADYSSHCVRVYNMEGDLLLTYGSYGSGREHLKCPRGLAFLNETDLVIADFHNHRMCIVNTTTGQLVRSFGRHSNGDGEFNSPYDVHVVNQTIIVCDRDNDRVQVFTRYQYQFGIAKPHSVVTHNGLLYVSTQSGVHVMDMKNGQTPTVTTTFGNKACRGDVQLKNPCGLAIDNDNNLLVCDGDSCIVHKFTLDGRHIGASKKLDNKPRHIAVLKDGTVICTTGKGVAFVTFDNA